MDQWGVCRAFASRGVFFGEDPAVTLDDLREAVTTLQDAERTARRVFGGSYPLTVDIEVSLRGARAALRARETLSPGCA